MTVEMTHENVAKALMSAALDNFIDSDGKCKCCVDATLAQKAAELLKSQEPQTVIVDDIPKDDTWFGIWFGRCPNCKEMLTKKYHKHFCGSCGQAVKWCD